MHSLDYLIKQIKINIPKPILQVAFKQYTKNGMFSLEHTIKEEIIFDLVLTDCNLFTGKIKKIKLLINYHEDIQSDDPLLRGRYAIYRIPPEVRESQPITYVLDVSYPVINMLNTVPGSFDTGQTYESVANRTLKSATGINEAMSPSAKIIDGELIRMMPPQLTHVDWIVSCIIGYNKAFSNITPGLLKPLSKLCIYATQMWIYNELVLEIEKGILMGGGEFGQFRDIVMDYRDAKESYDEALLKFRGASNFDQDNLLEWIGMMT